MSAETFPVAFAVVEAGFGEFRAVRLANVIAEHVTELVPGEKHTTNAAMAVMRCQRALEVERRMRARGKVTS